MAGLDSVLRGSEPPGIMSIQDRNYGDWQPYHNEIEDNGLSFNGAATYNEGYEQKEEKNDRYYY